MLSSEILKSLLSKSKLDNTFRVNQFKKDFQKMFWLDRKRYEGGLFLCIDEKVPCKILTDYTMSTTSDLSSYNSIS